MNNPPPVAPLPNKDAEHLNLLVTFHYILGALNGLCACFPLIHVGVGIAMMFAKMPPGPNGENVPPIPNYFGALFALFGGFMVLLGWATAICTFLSGRFMAKRRSRTFSFVTASLLCMMVPFGTVLGVFTLIVLSRDSVRRLYGEGA